MFAKAREFEDVDPFNSQNTLRGEIGINKSDYGCLMITHINDVEQVPFQVVRTTPKIPYPFSKDGKWLLPPVSLIEAYEKLDGTNIFMFRYTFEGETFVTYKTRLTPFVKNGLFGDFFDMWNRMLGRYPSIPSLFELDENCDGFSFEMFGSLNKHLIQYKHSLDTALLFGIKNNKIVPLSRIDPHHTIQKEHVPFADFITSYKGDFQEGYKDEQEEMETNLEKVNDDTYTGPEGQIWYAHTEIGDVLMFKCKPETVENIHWAISSPLIHENSIRGATYNSAESGDVNVVNVKTLLLEEYDRVKIELSHDRIVKIVREVVGELRLRKTIKEAIDMEGIDLTSMKLQDVMRRLAPQFTKADMRDVYNTTRQIKELMV